MKIKLAIPSVVFWSLLVLFFAITQIMYGNYFGPRETIVSIILFMLLYNWRRWIGFLHLGISCVCALMYGLVGLTYGHVDKNAIDALLYTNFDEAFEYATSIPPSVFGWYGGLLLTFACVVLFLKKHSQFLVALDRKRVVVLFVLLVAFSSNTFVKNLIKGNPLNIWDLKSTEVNFVLSFYKALEDSSNGQNKYSIFNRSTDWKAVADEGVATNYVLILGESARRDFFGAYGAPWNNTPWLSSEPGLLFENYISASAGTVPSLSRQLYLNSDTENFNPAYNIVTLAKSAGFQTAWISSQGERGGADSPISIVAKMSDKYNFVADDLNPLNKVLKKTDEDLLEPFKESLALPGKKLIVLHLIGSHPQACRRTNDRYTEFFKSQELSCYIESLKNTDRLAKEVTDALKVRESKYGEKWGLLFTADHGLDFASDQSGWCLKHNDKRQGSYEVPFFITGSGFNKRETIKFYRSGLNFLPLVASWMHISSPYLSPQTCHWLQDEACIDQENVYRFSGEKVRYQELPSYSLQTFMDENP